jgi:protein-disulfide isomerase
MRGAVLAAVLIVVGASPVLAQSAEDLKSLRQDIEALKEGQAAIQKELQELKTLLRARPSAAAGPPPEVVLTVGTGPSRGSATATLTLVEFTDYQCPFCGRYVRETYPQLDQEYIQTGKVRYVVRDLPLESIHRDAFKAAEATRCAHEQGKFWEMHDRLFARQQELGRAHLPKHAQALGLDASAFARCLEAGTHVDAIRKDMAEAQRLQATGTPTFFLGVTNPSGPQMKATRLVGAQPYAAFKEAIDRLLSAPR